jgi:hypothetical protein
VKPNFKPGATSPVQNLGDFTATPRVIFISALALLIGVMSALWRWRFFA